MPLFIVSINVSATLYSIYYSKNHAVLNNIYLVITQIIQIHAFPNCCPIITCMAGGPNPIQHLIPSVGVEGQARTPQSHAQHERSVHLRRR